jgi:hypothetical protein
LPVLREPYIPRDRKQLADLIRQQNRSFRTLAVPGKLGKTTIHKVITGQQETISYPKAELIAAGLGKRVEDLFRPQYIEEGE